MDPQIDSLLCKDCRPIVAATLDLERAELAVKHARDRLRELGNSRTSGEPEQQTTRTTKTKIKQRESKQAPAAGAAEGGLFKGRRSVKWRHVDVAHVLQNIRGDVSAHDLCTRLKIAESVLRRRVENIIGVPDKGRRWQKGVGYLIKGKPAWDHENKTLRVDKTKGAAMAAFTASKSKPQQAKASPGRQPTPGPTDEEIQAYLEGKLPVAKLTRRYKCGKGKIYRAIETFKVRFGADAPHGEPRAMNGNGVSNGHKGTAAVSATH